MANRNKEGEEPHDSADEALCELLGLKSIHVVADADIDVPRCAPEYGTTSASDMKLFFTNNMNNHEDCSATACSWQTLRESYSNHGFSVMPDYLNIPDWFMRRITDELVWTGDEKLYQSKKTYERVQAVQRGGEYLVEKRVLTRLEDFVNNHPEWKALRDYIGEILSCLLDEPMVLFKEKLNLKPPGGSGFAPHIDTPSLRVALGEHGPQTFVTVMVSIDPMTAKNGCLRLCRGSWGPDHHCCVLIPPTENGNPDADGRVGAIPLDVANQELQFEDVECPRGGFITAFGGWTPHRSAANASPFPRRAVFLTYNPASEGDFHDAYYQQMDRIRSEWRQRVGLQSDERSSKHCQLSEDEQSELDALATIPRF
ncbi:hypothetical protein ACA910_020148 [Epithemia clementina (nom. ined.)]